jgi:hypothetical protein
MNINMDMGLGLGHRHGLSDVVRCMEYLNGSNSNICV